QLSRLRAALVKRDTPAKLAAELELSESLFLGSGELKSGGFRRSSILADAMEAVIGAVERDGGLEAAQELVLHLYRKHLQDLDIKRASKDPKTRLQEFLQARGMPLPDYEVDKVSGEVHDQTFHVKCHVAAKELTTQGRGGSRRKAEQAAAEQALNQLESTDE
ncbi:MAG: ribonuclease III, partial [Gammaproteobacteria bacterium]|nr:ribonuclease III [Gammaproteobacteria bacterium]